jgi:purine catabolism regulator
VRLLATVDDPGALAAMARDALGPLGQLDEPGHADLVETLAALLAHNMHLAEAAEELYFHYNTIRHRLGRLRALLGERLTRPDERIGLSLAIAALRIAAVEQPQLAVTAGSSRR